jgi:hypothetical protein
MQAETVGCPENGTGTGEKAPPPAGGRWAHRKMRYAAWAPVITPWIRHRRFVPERNSRSFTAFLICAVLFAWGLGKQGEPALPRL